MKCKIQNPLECDCPECDELWYLVIETETKEEYLEKLAEVIHQSQNK